MSKTDDDAYSRGKAGAAKGDTKNPYRGDFGGRPTAPWKDEQRKKFDAFEEGVADKEREMGKRS